MGTGETTAVVANEGGESNSPGAPGTTRRRPRAGPAGTQFRVPRGEALC